MKAASGPYDDIIHLPHHVSDHHPRMSASERAAQFSPFAALTGYGDVIRESARSTSRKIDLDDDARIKLDQKLHLLATGEQARRPVSITYFLPDAHKEGGAYVTVTGLIRRIDDVSRTIYLSDGSAIPAEDVLDIGEMSP